jgi:hypothetical protein
MYLMEGKKHKNKGNPDCLCNGLARVTPHPQFQNLVPAPYGRLCRGSFPANAVAKLEKSNGRPHSASLLSANASSYANAALSLAPYQDASFILYQIIFVIFHCSKTA